MQPLINIYINRTTHKIGNAQLFHGLLEFLWSFEERGLFMMCIFQMKKYRQGAIKLHVQSDGASAGQNQEGPGRVHAP